MVEKNKTTCLICNKARVSRGLCSKHYTEFNRAKQSLTGGQREAFEELCIKKGRLLPSRAAGQRKKSAFEDLVAEIKNQGLAIQVAENREDYNSDDSKDSSENAEPNDKKKPN